MIRSSDPTAAPSTAAPPTAAPPTAAPPTAAPLTAADTTAAGRAEPGPAGESAATVAEPDARRAIALVIGVAATVGFVILRFVVELGGRQPLAIDAWWHDLMVAMTTPVGVIVAFIPAIVGGTIGMIVVGLILIALFLWRRRRWDALTLAVAMIVVVGIGAPLAAVIARVRPADSLAESVATSFPSGHTAVATTVAVVLGLLLRRGYIWALGAVWVVIMMWSRTFLHAHWLTDVTAGMLEGLAVACFVWCAVEAVRDRRAARSAPLLTVPEGSATP